MKRAVIIGGLVAGAAAIAAGLWLYGRPAYRKHRESTAAARATQFLAARQYKEASLSARQSLSYNPANLQACLVMARLAELAQAPQLLDWRRRIAEIAPSLTNKLALAMAAMQTQPPPFAIAAQTLEALSSTATNSVDYHAVAAQLALRREQFDVAAAHFEQACRLKPDSDHLRLNLAILKLASTNQTVSAQARHTLESLRSSTNVGPLSLRWLVMDRIRNKQFDSAEQLSRELLASGGCIFEDRLQHLQILQTVNAPSFQARLVEVQQQARTNSAAVCLTTAWMISHNLADAAALWISNCPPDIRADQLVSRSLAECYVSRKDWAGLEQFLQGEKWVEAEFLKLAYLSLVADRQKQPLGAQARWRSALREAGDRIGPLMLLLRLSVSWGRPEATEETLWAVVQKFPGERWALTDLERAYTTAGNTRGLYRLYTAMAGFDSRDYVAKNNLASTSLLLGVNLPKAHEQALEVFKEHPENPIVVTTYALSLHVQGKHAESLKAMEQLPAEALGKPPVCLYYGVVLAAAGHRERAGKYLEAARASELLPEERSLLTEALESRN